jgi:hypothetical protein
LKNAQNSVPITKNKKIEKCNRVSPHNVTTLNQLEGFFGKSPTQRVAFGDFFSKVWHIENLCFKRWKLCQKAITFHSPTLMLVSYLMID